MVARALISLHADTAYVVPVAAVDYVDLVVSAELDTSGRFRIIFETAVVVDGFRFVASKPIADTIALLDASLRSSEKAFADDFELQDSVSTLLVFLRTLEDGAETADASNIVFQSGAKVEQISVVDIDTFVYQKNLADSIEEEDGTDILSALQHAIAKSFGNQVFANEARSLIFATSRVESTSVADAGLLSMQDYCDLSYFAEDYVGISQIF
jgi:hypothetical protein